MIEHVIFINDYASVTGGLTKVALDGAKGLAALGVRVTYLALVGPVDPSLTEAGIDVRCMGQPDIWQEPNRTLAMTRGLWNDKGVRWVRQQIAEFDPRHSILHCQGYTRALSPAIGRLLIESGFPHVFTMHDYMLACPTGTFFDHKERQICTRRALGPSCLTARCDTGGMHHKAWRVARQAITHGPGQMPAGLKDIIYISEKQRQVMEPYLGPETRLHYVPNPISIEKAERVRAEDNDIFLFVSRLVPEKGGTLFAKAAKAAGVKAVFVGDGPERAEIQAIYPEAHITGWVTPAEVEEWLSKASCLVFPSLWYETFGLAIREALALGVPVICGEWFAGADAIRNGINGLIARGATVSEWAELIQEAASKRMVGTMSESAYSGYWKNPNTVSQHAQDLLSAYETILSNPDMVKLR
jgi:glycosyltransferase involved in cell wall biosynthesis